MIGSGTIQDNGDRTYNVSFIFLSHDEENVQKEGFRDLKRNGTQNWNLNKKLSKIGPIEKYWLLVKSQQKKSMVNCKKVNDWRVLMMQGADVCRMMLP